MIGNAKTRRRLGELVGVVLLGSLLAAPAFGGAPSDRKLESWVKKHSRKAFPTSRERKMDEIGWASTLGEAQTLAAAHRRPLFVFAYNGNIDTGRS